MKVNKSTVDEEFYGNAFQRPKTCAAKLTFDSQKQAQATATAQTSLAVPSPVVPYRCNECHLWHLTSR
jgi:hypothetical protein